MTDLVRDPTTGRMVKPCGTEAAWRRHYSRGEQPCNACRVARSRKQHIYRYRRHEMAADPWRVAWIEPCGTNAGHEWHRTHNQTPCDACTKAHNLQRRDHGRKRCRHDIPAMLCIPCDGDT